MACWSSIVTKRIQNIHNICKTERERQGWKKKKNTHLTTTYIQGFWRAAIFLLLWQPSSVSLAFFIPLCVFSFPSSFIKPLPSAPTLCSFSLQTVNITERPIKPALCSAFINVPRRRRSPELQRFVGRVGAGVSSRLLMIASFPAHTRKKGRGITPKELLPTD